MTGLAPLQGVSPSTPKVSQPGSRDGAPDGSPDAPRTREGFARALERRQAADVQDTAPRGDSATPAPPTTSPEDAAVETDDDAVPTTAVQSDATQPPPAPWPPPGLAALIGLPALADPTASSPTTTADTGDAAALPAAATAATPLPAMATGASAPIPAAALAAAAAATSATAAATDGDAVAPLALEIAATAETVDALSGDSAEPLPQAFALPASAPALLRAPAPMLDAPLPTPDLQGEDFEARFGAQLEWMAGQKISHARIRVTPNDLGPVEVRLQLDGDRIAADFVSAHAETRQMLEQGLPRLRELLGESGFQLAHAGVGNGGAQRDGNPAPAFPSGRPGDDDGASPPAPIAVLHRGVGLLDAYA